MQEWTLSTERSGYMEKTITQGNCIVRLFKPILTAAEREKREAHLKSVAERTLRNYLFKENGYGKYNSN